MDTSKETKIKLTKQGVRDLNHAVPKKRPAALEVKPAADEAVDEAVSVAPAPVVAAPFEP